MIHYIEYNIDTISDTLSYLILEEGDVVVMKYLNGQRSHLLYEDGCLGKMHREDGPASYNIYGEHSNHINGAYITTGHVEWWINGECITDEVEAAISHGKIKANWLNWDQADKAKFKLLFT